MTHSFAASLGIPNLQGVPLQKVTHYGYRKSTENVKNTTLSTRFKNHIPTCRRTYRNMAQSLFRLKIARVVNIVKIMSGQKNKAHDIVREI